VEQNERKRLHEESNPLKSCLSRTSCYLNGSDIYPAHVCFQEALGFELGRSRGYSHNAQCVSWVGSMPQYERVEHPAMSFSGLSSQEGLVHRRAYAIRVERIAKPHRGCCRASRWSGQPLGVGSETRLARADVHHTGPVSECA
jgi:hypothetical protein